MQLVRSFRRLDDDPGVEGGGGRRKQPEGVGVGDVVAGGGQVLAVRRRDGQHSEEVGGAERGSLDLDQEPPARFGADPVAVHLAGFVDPPVDDDGRVEGLVVGRLALEHLGMAADDDAKRQSRAGPGGDRGAYGLEGILRFDGADDFPGGGYAAAGEPEPRLFAAARPQREDGVGVLVVRGGDQLQAVEVPPLVAEAGVMDFDDVLPGLWRPPVEAGVDVDAGSLLVQGDLPAVAVENSEHRIDRRADAARLDLQHDPLVRGCLEAIAVPLRSVQRAVDNDWPRIEPERLGHATCVAQALLGDFGHGVYPEQQGVRQSVLAYGAQRIEPRRGVGVDFHQKDSGLEIAIVRPPLFLQPVLVGGLAEAGERAGQRALDLHLARDAVALDDQPQGPPLLAAVRMHVDEIRRRRRGGGDRGDGDAGERLGRASQQSMAAHGAPPAVVPSERPVTGARTGSRAARDRAARVAPRNPPSSGTGTNWCNSSPSAAR